MSSNLNPQMLRQLTSTIHTYLLPDECLVLCEHGVFTCIFFPFGRAGWMWGILEPHASDENEAQCKQKLVEVIRGVNKQQNKPALQEAGGSFCKSFNSF